MLEQTQIIILLLILIELIESLIISEIYLCRKVSKDLEGQ